MNMQDYFKVDGPVDQAMRELTNGKAQYQCRMEQVQYAEKVHACLEGGSVKPGEPTHVLAIEAETGVGKTNGALIPMLDRLARHLMAGEDKMARGALCTYTTALRRQIAGKDLPVALRAVEIVTGQRLEVAEYWGAQQYVSEEAIRKMSEGPLSSQDKDRMERILAWWDPKGSVQSVPGEKSVYYGSRLMVKIKHELGIEEEQPLFSSIDDIELMGNYDEVTAYPEYRDMREQVTAAHFILMSHAAVLFNGFRKFSLVGAEHPLQYLVVDEAHKIPDAAASIAKRNIALGRVAALLEQVSGQAGVPGGLLKSALRAVKSLTEKVYKAYPENRSGKWSGHLLYSDEISTELGTVKDFLEGEAGFSAAVTAMKALTKAIVTKDLSVSDKTRLCAMELISTAVEMQDFADALHGGNQYSQIVGISWSKKKHFPSLMLTALEPGRLLARYWRRYPGDVQADEVFAGHLAAAVITSATLPNMMDLGLFDGKDEHGDVVLPKFGWQVPPYIHGNARRPERIEPQGHFGSMSFVLTPNGKHQTMLHSGDIDPDEDDVRYVNPKWEEEHLIPMIKEMIQSMQPGDRTMILTPSYKDIDRMMGLMEGSVHYGRLLPQVKGVSMLATARQYARDENVGKVLISAGGWEGIDLPGMVQHLMVARIPRPPQDEIIKRAYMQKLGNNRTRVNAIMNIRTFRMTINKFRQGLGRGIRKMDDRTTLWIADSRFGLPQEALQVGDDRLSISAPISQYEKVIPERFMEDFREARMFSLEHGVFKPTKTVRSDSGASLVDDNARLRPSMLSRRPAMSNADRLRRLAG